MPRIQVNLGEEEYNTVNELAELRGQSLSQVIGLEVARVVPDWRRQVRELRKLRAQEERVAAELEKVLHRCGAPAPTGRMSCTLPEGHPGAHSTGSKAWR